MTPKLKHFRHLIGVPYLSGGRDAAIGLDCWGLFMLVQKAFGRTVPEVDVLCTETLAIQHTAKRQINQLWQPVSAPFAGIAAVMATDFKHPHVIQHVGVFLDTRHIIHCLQQTGVVIDNYQLLQDTLNIKGLYDWVGYEK